MRALVLSGGGLFGAWQAGAWSVLAGQFEPDLIVGCSIGSLNGYMIASGASPAEIAALWRDREFGNLKHLASNLQLLTTRYTLRRPFALVVTDLLRMQPVIYRDQEITWRHLAASCAVPLALPQINLDGRWYSDGGLLNPLPLYAAAELGATEIVALHVLKHFPSPILAPAVVAFRVVFGYRPDLPANVQVKVLEPSRRLGSLRDTLSWNIENMDAWLALGASDVRHFVT